MKIIPALFNVEDACTFLGVKRSMFYVLLKEGNFRKIKVRGKSMFSSTELKAWVDRKYEEAGQ